MISRLDSLVTLARLAATVGDTGMILFDPRGRGFWLAVIRVLPSETLI
jgi:hypothetical protein